MSGADYLAVILLAGFVIVTFAVDWLLDRVARRRHSEEEREHHRQLMRELRRLP